jgi:hypothetical protein
MPEEEPVRGGDELKAAGSTRKSPSPKPAIQRTIKRDPAPNVNIGKMGEISPHSRVRLSVCFCALVQERKRC